MERSKLIRLPFFILLCWVTTINAQSVYQYSVNLNDTANDRLRVSLVCPSINTPVIRFYLPRIVPGTYMNSNFGKYVHNLRAAGRNGENLAVKKIDDNTWEISNATVLSKIDYEVEDTWDAKIGNMVYPMAGTNFEGGKNFVLNTCGIFGYLENMKKTPFEINFTKPTGFYGATGLKAVSNTATAEKYICTTADELYDSPIMFSVPDTTTMQVGGAEVLVAVYSPKKQATSKFIAKHLEKLLANSKDYLKGKLPVDKYAFIFYFNSEQPPLENSGAWEHSYSSFYAMEEAPQEAAIESWVDIAAHEFFHIVTPLNISSREVKEFNFNETHLSKHLWLYEGSTEYYSHHMQVYTGMRTPKQFLDELANKISISRTYFNDSLSFAELSRESAGKWHDQFVNVYLKGAVINACLDLYLLKLSNGQYNLRDLKHDLGVKFGKDKYFLDDELYDAIAALSFPEIKTFLLTYVDGNARIPYEKFFDFAGINYHAQKIIQTANLGGISMKDDGKGVMLIDTKNINAFGLKMGYQENDEMIALNGQKIDGTTAAEIIGKFNQTAKEGDHLTVVVRRGKGKKKKEITLSNTIFKSDRILRHILDYNNQATAEQLKIRKAWFGKGKDALNGTADSSDVSTIDGVLKTLYGVISGPAGERDWNRFLGLFHADAYMAAINTKRELSRFTPQEYVVRNGPFFKQYSFQEKETGRTVNSFGNIAQAFTSYQFEAGTTPPMIRKGINSIELVQEKGRWWITSITWDEESAERPIPQKYLGF